MSRGVRTVLLGLGLVLAGGPARAHALLERAMPAVGSTVAASPPELTIMFSEAVEPAFSSITVQDDAGHRVDAGEPHVAPGDARRLIVGLRSVPAGTYTVIWRVTSVDTHQTQGHFTFTVAP